VVEINHVIRPQPPGTPCLRLVDLYGAPSMTDPDTWSTTACTDHQGGTIVRRRCAEALGLQEAITTGLTRDPTWFCVFPVALLLAGVVAQNL